MKWLSRLLFGEPVPGWLRRQGAGNPGWDARCQRIMREKRLRDENKIAGPIEYDAWDDTVPRDSLGRPVVYESDEPGDYSYYDLASDFDEEYYDDDDD